MRCVRFIRSAANPPFRVTHDTCGRYCMGELLSDIVSWMVALPPVWAYVMILVIAYGENVLPPIPGDMVVVFGGYLVGLDRLSFGWVVLLATVGGTAGFMTMYAIGYRVGTAVFDPNRLTWLPKREIGKAERWLRRWGYGVVLGNRFLSGLRSVISLTVGMARMHRLRTTVFAAVSAFLWTLLLTYAGFTVGDNWPVVSLYLKQYGAAVTGLVLVLVLVYFVRRLGRRAPRSA